MQNRYIWRRYGRPFRHHAILREPATPDRSVDIAEAEFKRTIAEDNQLHTLYREWCHDNGSSERNGFLDFCEEYLESQDSKWDSLSDYDDQE